MNTDIRLAVNFWQHPKVYRLEKRLGLKAIRSLQILWSWCAQNRPDGNLADLAPDEIEFVSDWRGKKGAFFEACIGEWIDETEAGYALHEWADYNPYQAQAGSREEARKEKARNAANARWGKDRQADANGCSSNANNNPSICSNDAQAYANGCSSNATSNAQNMPSLTSTSTEELNTYTAPPDGAAANSPASEKPKAKKAKGRPPDEPHYQAKSGRYLTGKRLESFAAFWQAFAFPKGKAEAADAWLDIPELTDGLVARICDAARQEAAQRDRLLAKGQAPKWAQGWINARRWEDYEPQEKKPPDRQSCRVPERLGEEDWQKAQEMRKRLEAERQRQRMEAQSA